MTPDPDAPLSTARDPRYLAERDAGEAYYVERARSRARVLRWIESHVNIGGLILGSASAIAVRALGYGAPVGFGVAIVIAVVLFCVAVVASLAADACEERARTGR